MNKHPSTFFENKTKVYLTLVLIPFCIYFKSFFYDFSPMDDQWMIIKNADLLSNWGNIGTFFTKPLAGLYYRPLFSISLMLDFHIGKTAPFIYHISNLIYHLIAVILLYKLFLILKVEQKTSFFLSLIFSVHPILLHAIAWVPGRNDILLTIFTLCALIYLIKFFNEQKKQYLIFHFIFFICAILTKENAFVLPVIFTMLIYYFKQPKKTYLLLFLSWLITLLGWYILRSLAVKSSLSLGSDIFISIKNFIIGLLLYIGKSTIPAQQSIFPTLKNSTIVFGVITIVIISFAVLKKGLKNKILALLGLIVFFSMLSIPVWYGATGSSGEHYEHRIYLPLIGLLLFISQINFNQNSPLFIYSACLIVFIFSIKTFLRMDIYKNEKTFVNAGLKEAPDYYYFYAVKADQFLIEQNYAASVPFYNSAIKLQPMRPQLYSSRGYAYVELGRKEEAINDYTKAIEYTKGYSDMYLNRCLAYTKFGEVEKAVDDLTYLKKNYPQTIPKGLEEDLLSQWSILLEKNITSQILANPKNATLYIRRAKIFLAKNRSMEALEDIKHACELEPNNALFKTYLNQFNARMK